jgi:hypothetical protein
VEGGACEPLGRLHGMPVGRGLSKVYSPLSLLPLETVTTCPTGAHYQNAIVFSLDDRARELLRPLLHSYPKELGTRPGTHEQREWTTI